MDLSFILPLLLGWISGLLVNYLADVLPVARRLYRPVCPVCQVKYKWLDYLFFRSCPTCGKRRRWRFIVTQVLMTAVSLLVWIFPNPALPYLLAVLMVTYLAVVFVIDLEHRVILHPVSLAGILIGIVIGITLRGSHSLWHGVYTSLLGGAVGFGVMLVFYFAGEWYVKFMAKKRGLPADEVALGFGDVNLSGILGLILGWPGIVLGLTYGILAAGVVSIIIILGLLVTRKYRSFFAIPYAPFLIMGTVFLLYLV